jgi:outer membrane cobalamin receptor
VKESHRIFIAALALALPAAWLSVGWAQTTPAAGEPATQQAADASSANTADLDEVIVTATASSSGMKKLDASFEITTASLDEIHDAGPLSSADLLKIVPGLWAESSGGETGPNIELAGYPGNSGAPYVTYSINGSPVYPSHNLSFMDDSSLFRLDDTIERTEVVIGGPSVVFSDGQLGATANFILRQGGATPHGDVGVTVGSEGMYRLDGFYGGPLTQGWSFSIGGYYEESDGIRSSQFPAVDGGQLTATLTHDWDDGSILFYARMLNEKDLFITDIPLTVTGTGSSTSYSSFPGFNALTGYYAGSALQGLSVQECPGCAPLTANLANGRGTNMRTFGSDLTLQVASGVQLDNKLQFSVGDIPTNAIFNGGNPPETIANFITGAITSANGNAGAVGAGGLATGGTATYTNGGAAVNPNTYVMENGFWVVDKQIQSFTDDLRFTFDLMPGNKLTTGAYFAAYTSNDTWYLGNDELMTATPNSQLINLTLNNGAVISNNGLAGASFYTLIDQFQGINAALFASDQWRVGPWLVDAGYRLEREKVDGTIENDTSENLDNNPLHLYNQGVSVPNGTFNVYNCEDTLQLGNGKQCDVYERTKGSWTIGGTYELSSHQAAYVRIDQGVYLPSFDDLRNGTPQTQSIDNYEVGYRMQTPTIYANVDAFVRQFTGVPFQQFVTTAGGGLESVTASYGAHTYGLDFDGRYTPIDHLTLALTGDLQHDVYTSFFSAGAGAYDYSGNYLARQPRFQARFTPSWDQPMDWGSLRFFATYSYVGLRYSDPANEQVLPAYGTLDGGVVADLGKNFEIRLQGTNLTDALGVTEQDARANLGGNGASGGFALGRPIFGREVNLQLKYKF